MVNSARILALWLIVCLSVVACSSGGGSDAQPPNDVATPDAVGSTQAQAEASIRAAGLLVGTVTQQSSNTVPLGDVISQTPAAGAMVTNGTSVNLVVSSGPATTAVPNVTGLSQAQASSDITAAGLQVGNVTQQNSASVPAGDVISQNPTAGTMVSPGAAIDLVVSQGPGTVSVPNVTGLSQTQASSDITAAGLQVGNIAQQNSASVPAGDVISQNPTAGTMVSPGSDVDLVVSDGPGTVSVPNVIGLSQAQASSSITAAGLQVGNITQQNSAAVPTGDVISQNPSAGTMVSATSSVDLVISLGPSAGGFSDEFSNDSLSDWSLRHVVEGTAAQYTTLDVNQSRAGHLTIIPTQTPGWLNDDDGPFIHKTLAGNFSVHARVFADSVSNPGQPPSASFNSAGLMVRDPSSIAGPENWFMLNIGRQDSGIPTGVGSEYKNTINSASALTLQQGSNQGELILCRVGNSIISFRMLDGDASWIQLSTFDRPDFPATVQVGMIVNGFGGPVDLRAEFDFIRLLPTPASSGDCTPP